jgi:hypothetical protein
MIRVIRDIAGLVAVAVVTLGLLGLRHFAEN